MTEPLAPGGAHPEDPDPAAEPEMSTMERARFLADALAEASGGRVDAVVLYGSHLLKASPDRFSAYDFVVLVDDYGDFFRSLKASGEMHRPAWILSLAARVLPPNVIAFTPQEGREGIAKCLVLSREHFAMALGPRPRDHFLLGRMIQKVALVWARSDASVAWVEARLAEARAGVMSWAAPYVEADFDAESLGRTLLAVCYRGEFRPEAGDRSDRIFEGQRDHFVEHLTPILATLGEEGALVALGGEPARYRLAESPSWRARWRWRWHFIRSKARVTARWPKHVLTFDNWLPYISRKVERRTGMTVEVTPWERRLPLLLLWPKVIRVLRARPDKENPS